MKPNADHKHFVTYTIRQKTTAPDLPKTIEAFEAELKLQYGSSVELLAVTWEDGRPPQTEELFADEFETRREYDEATREAMHQGARFHGPATDPMVADDLDQGDREAIVGASIACGAHPARVFTESIRDQIRRERREDLGLEGTGRSSGW